MKLPSKGPFILAMWLLLLPELAPVLAESPYEGLALEKAIALALDRNYSLMNSQKDLELALSRWRAQKDVYAPLMEMVWTESVDRAGGSAQSAFSSVTSDSWRDLVEGSLSQTLPTGASASINGEVQIERDETADDGSYDSGLSVAVSQPLLKGAGRRVTEAELSRAKNLATRQEMDLELAGQDLVLQVVASYNELMKSDLLVKVRERAIEQAQNLLNAAQVRFEVGNVAEIDVLRGQFQVKESQSNVTEARRFRTISAYALLSLLCEENMELSVSLVGMEALESLEEFKTEPVDMSQSIEAALACRLDLKELDLDMKNGQISRIQALDGMKDEMNLIGRYGYADEAGELDESLSFSDPEWGLGLEVGLTRLMPSQREALVEADIGIQKIQNTIQERRIQILREVRESVTSLLSAEEKIRILRDNLSLARETFDLTRGSYLEGLVTSFDLLQAQNDLTRTETDYFGALIDYKTQVYRHKKATGELKIPGQASR